MKSEKALHKRMINTCILRTITINSNNSIMSLCSNSTHLALLCIVVLQEEAEKMVVEALAMLKVLPWLQVVTCWLNLVNSKRLHLLVLQVWLITHSPHSLMPLLYRVAVELTIVQIITQLKCNRCLLHMRQLALGAATRLQILHLPQLQQPQWVQEERPAGKAVVVSKIKDQSLITCSYLKLRHIIKQLRQP